MVVLLPEPDRGEVRIVEEVVDAVVRRRGDPGLAQPLEPLRGRAVRHVLAHQGVELVEVLGACRERREPRFLGEVRKADELEESLPVLVAVHDDRDPTVGRGKRTAERRRHPRVARFAARRFEDPAPKVLDEAERGERLGHRHFDHGTLAR